jgi:hypothetical protein
LGFFAGAGRSPVSRWTLVTLSDADAPPASALFAFVALAVGFAESSQVGFG